MKKLTTNEFILKAKDIHGTKYTYDKVVYLTSKKPIIITCPVHGNFEQSPNSHLAGSGCNRCGISATNQANRQPKSAYISKASKVHNNFYSYVKLEYTTVHDKFTITCPIHGDFRQKGNCHLSGQGCTECGKTKSGNSRSFFSGKRTILYLIKIGIDKYKIGVTTRTVAQRYYGNLDAKYEILFQVSFFDGTDAFNIEQQIVKEFRAHNYVGEMIFKRTKNHEVFKTNPIERIKELILNKVSL